MKKIFILSMILVAMSLIAFFLIPNSLAIFSFSGNTFFSGEVWRLLTFPFAHIGLSHLIENIIALAVTSLLAFELGLRGKEFIGVFLLSGIVIALADSFLFPTLLIAGLSVGIYAALGSLSISGPKFIPRFILVPLLGLSAFIKYLFSAFNEQALSSSLFHFAGFVTGISIFYIFIKLKKKPRILQMHKQ